MVSMPVFRTSLPCIFQKCPETTDLTHFSQSKLHHIKKLTDHNQNLISDGGGQDKSACQISLWHSFCMFSRKCQEITNFTWVKIVPNLENQQTAIKIYQKLQVVRIHQHAKFQAISSMRSPESAWKLSGQTNGEQHYVPIWLHWWG